MDLNSKIYIAGHNGMVGSAIWRNLESKGYFNLLGKDKDELDLLNQQDVIDLFKKEKPQYVILAAAKVGGILANNAKRAQFIYENLMIQANIIHQSYLFGVEKLLFLGSSCIYPKFAPQPMNENYLMTGILEETNEPYAIAKIAGIKMCEAYRDQYGCNFISVMPTNLYGLNDNYDLNNSHVLPALIRKFHEAKLAGQEFVEIWGTGDPKREFLHADDMASACVFIMQNYNESKFLNIGCGEDISIRELALLIKRIVGYKGNMIFDKTKPDGTPRKLLDITRLKATGWKPTISLEEGIADIYETVFLKKSH
jgi:GDP-L-fucose synthase